MTNWRDIPREKRVHVVSVRGLKDRYVVILSDGGSFDWDHWIGMDDDERNGILYEVK